MRAAWYATTYTWSLHTGQTLRPCTAIYTRHDTRRTVDRDAYMTVVAVLLAVYSTVNLYWESWLLRIYILIAAHAVSITDEHWNFRGTLGDATRTVPARDSCALPFAHDDVNNEPRRARPVTPITLQYIRVRVYSLLSYCEANCEASASTISDVDDEICRAGDGGGSGSIVVRE